MGLEEICYNGFLLSFLIDFRGFRVGFVILQILFSLQRHSSGQLHNATCIGCLLFNLYINDITDNLNPGVTVKLFADDVTIYSSINHEGACTDVQTFCIWFRGGVMIGS